MVLAHTNVWANGALVATDDVNKTHFYLNDWLGTRRVQTDYAGTLEQSCASLPYGDGETCGPAPTENLYTGKERDAESGNDYFGARYYASTVGRFLSPDWANDAEDVPYGNFADPQSLDLYSYVRNNPLSHIDPTGHDGGCCVADPEEGTTAAETVTEEEEVTGGVIDLSGGEAILGVIYVIDKLVNPPTVYTGDLPLDKNGNPIVPKDSLAPQPGKNPNRPTPRMAEHTKRRGSKKRTNDKHTKVDSGKKQPPNFRPHRKYQQPKHDKQKNQPKQPYRRKDRDG